MANDLWRDCASWLTRCGVLRPDHKANWPEATLTDLAYTLRDGVLLCNFVHSIDPGCIDMKDVNQKPQFAQFLCLRNIKAFLQACHEFYGIKESDLFEPSMLFDLTDLYRVIHTLSKLSNCPKVQRHNIPGFSVHKPRTLSQEDIYRNLSSNSGEEEARAVIEDCVEYAHYDTHIRNEEIYQDLCSIDKHAVPTLFVPITINHSFEKRDYVINELIETEKNYIDVLSTLQRSFVRPLSAVLKEDDIKVIFGGIKELYEIHVGFHSQLTKGIMPGSPYRLSEAFLNWREKFLAYGEYCANLTNAQARIQDLSAKNESFNLQLMRCQEEANNGKFKLRDILSVPMQRILKYHLLLEKLISETQPNHEDYRGLERAREAMVDVAQYINEVKRDSDALQIMNDMQSSIIDMPENAKLSVFGRLLKDGELRIKSHNNQKVKNRYVFIFDKVMLMCKALRGDQYSYKDHLFLADYKVDDAKRGSQQNTRWNYQWFLVRRTESSAFTLYARFEEDKRKWLKALQDAMDNIEPHVSRNTDHKFAMHTFKEPTTCSHCSKFLKGIIYQGYKCDKCSIAAHKNCIIYSGRCGLKQPPELPPRPPLAPRHDSELNNIHPPLPRPASGPPDLGRTWTDHGPLAEYLWFVGEMGREKASQLLDRQHDGTYLLRIRPQGATHPNETVYALSLKADDKVKHMKVYEKETDGVLQCYLSESRFFRSLVDLISFYEHTSLGENFIGLDIRLKWPYRRILAIAEFDFNPVESNQLPLKQGCQVIVLSKEGDQKGWWKGMIQDRVGFFPKVYVREITDTLQSEFH